ncbi:MAG: GIY-YIG nuclease family protein [Candidatus Omnitrophica bacterium]|nr:GIY-YIG nuclease family protein [Candidatus Omnitrophota bacterium]
MFFVYVLISERDKKFYIGFSENLEERIKSHNSGSVESTKNRRPLELIYYEAYLDKRDAEGRELFLKSGSGHRFLNKQLKFFFENRFAGWSSLVARKAQFLGSSAGNG